MIKKASSEVRDFWKDFDIMMKARPQAVVPKKDVYLCELRLNEVKA